MANFWSYILQSITSGKYYCGSTNNLKRRIIEHNDPSYRGSKTTKNFLGPWKLIWNEKHPSRSSAMLRERQIKKRGIGRFLAKELDKL